MTKQERLEADRKRIEEMMAFEDSVVEQTCPGALYVCGIDEAGRGQLAGPVSAAAVILRRGWSTPFLNDSKKLSAAKRDELYDVIRAEAIAYAVVMVPAERIDEINILQATKEAMLTAVHRLPILPEMLLIDAVKLDGTDLPQASVIKGDARCQSIAAASILAKVERDRLMARMDSEYPEYGFLKHKGYGTKEHIEAIQKFGPCPYHRRTFIKSFL